MLEIRKFKAEKNEHNRTYYAVTGASDSYEAVQAVVKFKKCSSDLSKCPFSVLKGVIAPYTDELDGIWIAGEHKGGTPCFIVWR